MNWFLVEQAKFSQQFILGTFGRSLNLWGSPGPVAQITASVHQTVACLVALDMQHRWSTVHSVNQPQALRHNCRILKGESSQLTWEFSSQIWVGSFCAKALDSWWRKVAELQMVTGSGDSDYISNSDVYTVTHYFSTFSHPHINSNSISTNN